MSELTCLYNILVTFRYVKVDNYQGACGKVYEDQKIFTFKPSDTLESINKYINIYLESFEKINPNYQPDAVEFVKFEYLGR